MKPRSSFSVMKDFGMTINSVKKNCKTESSQKLSKTLV